MEDSKAMPRCQEYELISLLGQGGRSKVYRAKNKARGLIIAALAAAVLVFQACAILSQQRTDLSYGHNLFPDYTIVSGITLFPLFQLEDRYSEALSPLLNMEIRSTDKGVLYKCKAHSMKEAVADAISKKVNLTGANFANKNLGSGTEILHYPGERYRPLHFEGIDLSGADFTGTSLVDASFSNCILDGAIFRRAILDLDSPAADAPLFDKCSLKGVRFLDSRCEGRLFKNCDLRDSVFDEMNIKACVFRDCNLSNSKLIRSSMPSAIFERANVEDADFIYSDLSTCAFWKSAP